MSKASAKLNRIDAKSLASNPRASYSAWQRYADVVTAARLSHPRPYVYQPTNLSPCTVASRLREAIRGAIAFNYLNDEQASHALYEWYSEVVIKHDTTHVYIGKPESVVVALQGVTSVDKPSNSITIPSCDLAQFQAFALLLSTNLLSGPVYISAPPDISTIPPYPNLEIVTNPSGGIIIL